MNPRLEFTEDELAASIPDRLDKVVAATPDAIAIDDGERALTYAQLNHAANRVAALILQHTDDQPAPVATLLDFGIDSILALLGILKAGKIFVGLEAWFPLERLQTVIDDTNAALLLTTANHQVTAGQLAGEHLRVLVLDQPLAIDPAPPVNRVHAGSALMGIFYTSGSTGKPKGVMVAHQDTLHRSWNEHAITGPRDQHPFFYSLSFKASLSDVFNPLLNGATVCPFNMRERGAAVLANWLNEMRITNFRPSMTILRAVMESVVPGTDYPHLRQVAVGGDKLFQPDVERFRSLFPGARLYHRLALSEAGLVTRLEITEDVVPQNGYYPVGLPMAMKEVLILDEDRNPLPPGAVGEIAVKSRFLTPGYWRDPDLTAQKFLPSDDPDVRICLTGDLGMIRPDGYLVHLGRKDQMVKVRGYRVEIAEIEAALHDLPAVQQAVVTARTDSTGENQLVGYIIPQAGLAPDASSLREALAQKFPDYMIPARYLFMEKFPLTLNTKVDRRRLPEPTNQRPQLAIAYRAPQTTTETRLAAIWADVLALESIGVDDSFLDLGGNSMLAMRITGRVYIELQAEVSIATLLEATTVAEMAAAIDQNSSAGLVNLLDEIENLTDEQIRELLSGGKE